MRTKETQEKRRTKGIERRHKRGKEEKRYYGEHGRMMSKQGGEEKRTNKTREKRK